MIKSFKHKGLELFFQTGSLKGIQPQHKDKLQVILTAPEYAECIEELNIDMFRLHQLKGDLKGLWSIKVNGNRRITFEFKEQDVYIVDYQDYH